MIIKFKSQKLNLFKHLGVEILPLKHFGLIKKAIKYYFLVIEKKYGEGRFLQHILLWIYKQR